MKIFILGILIISGLFLSACTKHVYHDDGAYNRANKASTESLRSLERDTK